jgi:hypothetical protein
MTAPPEGPWREPPPAVEELDELAARTTAAGCPAQAAYWGSVQLLDHLFAAVARTDPRTGRRLPQSLHQTLLDLAALLQRGVRPVPEDVLARAAALCHTPLLTLLARPRRRLRRTHTSQPAHKVRELDTRSMAWLARRPGRTAREKVGAARHVLGVTRLLLADTVENRVARRLADELLDRIGRRLACAGAYDSHTEDSRARLELLRQVYTVCAEGLPGSLLADVPPAAGVIRPNNVLLSDPVYGRVWRAWNWLRGQEGEVGRLWVGGPERLALAVFWLLPARLCDQVPVLLPDTFCRVGEGHEGPDFGIQQFGPGGEWEGSAVPPHLRLLCNPHSAPAVLDFRLDGDRVRVERSELAGAGVVCPGSPEVWEVEVRFTPDRRCQPGRYLPFTGRVRRNGETFQVINDCADLQGFRQLADSFFRGLLGRRPVARAPIPSGGAAPPEVVSAPRLLGLDPAGVWPRAVTEQQEGLAPLDLRLHATHVTFADGTGDWLDGRGSRAVSPWPESHRTISFAAALGRQRGAARVLAAAAVQRMMTTLADTLRPAHLAPLALAVPDTLDELAQRDLRASVAPAFAKLWLIPRSVAGALGWQTLDSFSRADLRDGDSLVVLDAEAPALTATWLLARYDSRLDGGPTRGFFWERRPLAGSAPRHARLTYRDLLARYGKRALHALPPPPPRCAGAHPLAEDQVNRLVQHLLDTGDAERLVEQQVPVWLPVPPGSAAPEAWFHLTLHRRSLEEAAGSWLEDFTKLLGAWVGKVVLRQVRDAQRESPDPEAARRPLRVLLLGRPFHNPWLRQQAHKAFQDLSGGLLGEVVCVEADRHEELAARNTGLPGASRRRPADLGGPPARPVPGDRYQSGHPPLHPPRPGPPRQAGAADRLRGPRGGPGGQGGRKEERGQGQAEVAGGAGALPLPPAARPQRQFRGLLRRPAGFLGLPAQPGHGHHADGELRLRGG